MNTRSLSKVHRPTSRGIAGGGATRTTVALAVSSFLGMLAIVAPPPLFPAMARELGVSVPLLAQIGTAILLLGAGLALLTGPLADRYGHHRLLVLGAIAAAGCLLGFGLAPIYVALLVPAVLGGVANATLTGLSLAVARVTFTGAAQRRAIGWATAGGAAAAVAGVPFLAALSGIAGWRVAFIAAGTAAIGAAWGVHLWISLDAKQSVVLPRAGNLLTPYYPLLRHRPTRQLYTATILRSLCWTGLVTYFGAFLAEERGFGPLTIGITYMLGGAAYVAGSVTAGHLPESGRGRPMAAVMNLALACAVGLTFSGVFGAMGTALLLPLAGFAGGTGWVGMVTLLAEQAPGRAGTTMTLNTALLNLGAAGGSALGGAMLASEGYKSLGLVLPAFALAAAFFVLRSGASRGETSCMYWKATGLRRASLSWSFSEPGRALVGWEDGQSLSPQALSDGRK
jgi:DHA1 family inner membrane transport protein